MKNLNIIISVLFVIAVCGFLFALIQGNVNETKPVACTTEAMICPDGSAVGRTGPQCEFTPCPEKPDTVQAHIDAKKDLIVLETPTRDSIIKSPLTITGKARGVWYFEASFPISIVDWDGKIIGQGIAQADGDWMTENFVPFTAKISFVVASDTPYSRGAIILKKDNPSGLPEHDDALEIPVRF